MAGPWPVLWLVVLDVTYQTPATKVLGRPKPILLVGYYLFGEFIKMWPSWEASGCMNYATVQNIKEQKQTKARRVAPFLSTDRNYFFDQYIESQRGIAKKNANGSLIGHKRFSHQTNAFLPSCRHCGGRVLAGGAGH